MLSFLVHVSNAGSSVARPHLVSAELVVFQRAHYIWTLLLPQLQSQI